MRIILCGAGGRMGKMVASLAAERGETVVCGIELQPMSAEFPVYTKIGDAAEEADVLIDFSSADGVAERLGFAKRRRLPVVLAQTGFTAADEEQIAIDSRTIPIFKTGNLSVGINLLEILVARAASALKDFDVEIVERHHSRKKDAPSGTALMLAESVRRASADEKENVYSRHGMVGERQKKEIGIHAVRGGTIVGEHEVMFAGEDEIVTLSHSARSRGVFANGALRAASWLISKPAGLYDMHDLLREQL